MSDTDHIPGGLPDPGMVASADGLRASDPGEMDSRLYGYAEDRECCSSFLEARRLERWLT